MPVDFGALKAKQARRTASGWTPKSGENIIRLLPHTAKYYTESVADFAIEFRSHFLKWDGMDTEVFRCLRDTRQPCPFCEAHKKIKDSADPNLKKVADQIRGGERHLMNIVNMNDPAAGIQAFESGPKVYDGFIEYIANPAWGDLLHPQQGRNFTLKLTPQGQTRSGYNEYSVQPHPNPSDVLANLPADWQEKLDKLVELVPRLPDDASVAKWLKFLGLVDAPVPVASVPMAPTPTPPTLPSPAAPPPPPTVTVQPAVMSPPTPPTIPAPVTAPPAPVAAAAPIAPMTPVAAAAPGQSPKLQEVINFVTLHAAKGLSVVNRGEGERAAVPSCFTAEAGKITETEGFNTNRWPCTQGCPVKADCQLRSLNLA